jgi:hypothetical protein
MFCLIYRFRVHEGKKDRFVQSWSQVTAAFIESAGALGSRLHSSDSRDYIAYAQWPSRSAWEEAELPSSIMDGPLAVMRDCCESIETLFELTPVADHLIPVAPDDA